MAVGDTLKGAGSSQVEQLFLWQVVGQLISVLLSPAFNELSRAVNRATTTTPLTPSQLADMVVRNIIDAQVGTIYASESGIKDEDFQRMVHGAGDALSPQELIEAYRRQLIPLHGKGPDVVSVEQGVAEGRTFNKYFDTLIGLARQHLTVADAVDAVVESQIDYAAGEAIAALNGVTAEDFRTLYNARGNPPAPMELITLYRKGIIPRDGTGPNAISVEQGVAEGATKNKWFPYLFRLAEYIPPPRTVVAMIREGTLTDDAGLKLLSASGLTSELAAQYVASAHHQRTQTHRDLTTAEVLNLYKDRIIDGGEAKLMLNALTWQNADIAFLLDLSDFQVEQQRTRSAISRIHNLYVAHKIDATEATTALDGLGVAPAGRDKMISDWNFERDANVPELTRGEIVDAVYYGVYDVPAGIAKLQDLGWSADEALVLITIRFKGNIPAAPKP